MKEIIDLWKNFNKVQKAKYLLLVLILIPTAVLDSAFRYYSELFDNFMCLYWRWIYNE